MKFLVSFVLTIFLSLYSSVLYANLAPDSTLPALVLEGKEGGLLDGSKWSSESMAGKVAIIFYVDPDEKDKNNAFSEALKERDFSEEVVRSYAIINMAATWLPNFAISSSLEEKQKKYPRTTYLRDMKKKVVSEWGLADDENNVVILSAQGKVLFSKFGQLNETEIEQAIAVIESQIAE